MAKSGAGSSLDEQLARWTAIGLIDAQQAIRIETAEKARPQAHSKRLPLVVEALGYIGAVVAIAAAAIAVRQLWPKVPPGVELAFAGIFAAGLLAAGAAVRPGGEPALARLRSVLWVLSVGSAAGSAAVLTYRFAHLDDASAALITAAAWTAWAVPLWWRSRMTLQHLATFAGTAAMVGAALYLTDDDVPLWGVGLAIWAMSALWGIAAYRGYLQPRTAGLAAACTGVLTGAIVTMDTAAGQALAALTVAGLLAGGVAARRLLLTGFGAAGALWVIPEAAGRYLPGSLAGPIAAAAVGLSLLGVALLLAKIRKPAPVRQPPS